MTRVLSPGRPSLTRTISVSSDGSWSSHGATILNSSCPRGRGR
ncbi:hypothetical protein ACFFX0_02275 [Citricoccus parietis]|uniref:Uncharacterized protein n=1 Tax=Citricoccus parietis TaxID=592307 RepID=A0ABV5FTR5_9MICC